MPHGGPPGDGRVPHDTVGSGRPHWEHLEHGASLGVRGLGPTKAAAFEQAALALTAVIADPHAVRASATVAITCEADDDEALLLAWLNAVIHEMVSRQMLFSCFHVHLQPGRLIGSARGERVGVERSHRPSSVKRATRDNLSVARTPDGWLAQLLLQL
jgi:SHS2 domain-containing protein